MAIDMTKYNEKFDSIVEKMQTLGSSIQATPKTLTAIDIGLDSVSAGGGKEKEILDGSLTELTSLGGATSLAPYRFYNFTDLETLNLSGIDEIPNYLCDGCSALTNLTLSDTLTAVGQYAFRECRNLEITELPAGLSSISQYGFQRTGFNKVGFDFEPTNPITIGNYAFEFSGLKKLKAEISSIGSYVFSTNSKLTSIDIEVNGSIGVYAFRECSNVSDFKISGNITSLGDYAFNRFGELRANPASNVFKFDLRNGTFASVGQYAFQGSSNTVRNKSFDIFLPSIITEVGNYAFRYTDDFNIFFTGQNVPTVQSATFTNSSGMKIFVPYAKANAYRTATNWSVQSGIIYGWAEENKFTLGQDLPFANEEGYGLTWYDDLAMTNQVTTVADPTKPLYCAVGSTRIAVLFKSLSQYQATSVITDGIKNYVQGDVIAVGTNLTITLTGDTGFNTPYITTLNGNNITSPHSFTVGQDDLEIVNIFWDGVNIPINQTFNLNTPAQIKSAFDNNLAKNFWTKGDNINITLTDSTPANVRIADLQEGRYAKVGGGSTNGVLEFSMQMPTTAQMNTTGTNAGGYEASRMRTVTMNEIFNLLPSEWQVIIPTVLVPTANGGSQAGTTVTLSENKLFLPSEIEVCGNSNNSHAGEGTQFDYYVGTNNSAKVKLRSGTAKFWWLRSPYRNYTNGFVYVSTDGSVNYISANVSYGVSPCFAI